MAWTRGLPPKGVMVALVVRKWVGVHGALRISFLAASPEEHLLAFGKIAGGDVQVEPSQTVRTGKLTIEDGDLVVLDEEGEEADFEPTAILAWAPVPSFALDQAAAKETELLLRQVAHGSG